MDAKGKQLVDAIAVASIVTNSTDLGGDKDAYIGIDELCNFLRDFQQEQLTPQELKQLIQVRLN
jgi:hypothetical protein